MDWGVLVGFGSGVISGICIFLIIQDSIEKRERKEKEELEVQMFIRSAERRLEELKANNQELRVQIEAKERS